MLPLISKISQIENLVYFGKLSDALEEIESYVERVVTEPLCVGQVFGSYDLDLLCQKIGTINLSSLEPSDDVAESDEIRSDSFVYLVSKLQNTGGHSRLVQDFIGARPESNHVILSTEIGGPSDINYLRKIFNNIQNLSIECAPNGSLIEKLSWLQCNLLRIKPKHAYLFNHHQDSVAVSAIVPSLGIDASFCHHGDHHLCLGVYMDHLVHIDFHPMGYHHCRNMLGIKNTYIPLTYEDKTRLVKKKDNECLITATAAGFNKLEIPYYVSYLKLIPKILKETNGKHLHIGQLTPWGLRTLYAEMQKLGVSKDSFIYVEWTPSVWNKLKEFNVDIYLASFPYGAGLTLIEAMGAGIPVVLHQHFHSRILSGLELAYPEAFSWSSPDDLINYLKNISKIQLAAECDVARQQYEKYHQSKILHKFFNDPNQFHIAPPELSSKFKPRLDEWAAWVDEQLNYSNILFRFIYRIARKIKRHKFSEVIKLKWRNVSSQ